MWPPSCVRALALKIENEQFNVQKNHAVWLEHNYGYGQQTLSMVFYLLNLLAFIAHIILERGNRLYQRCLATTSRRELWHTLRTAMHLMLVTTWTDFLLLYLDEAGSSPSPVRCRRIDFSLPEYFGGGDMGCLGSPLAFHWGFFGPRGLLR